MRISVVTVCYNAINDIECTILSVINQTYKDIEYIVIDGASTDGTVDILSKYSKFISCIISESDKGIYDAMNKGIDIATGDYVIFMNAGDMFISDSIVEVCANKMDNYCGYYGDALFTNTTRSFYYGGYFTSNRLTMQNICHQSIFYPLKELKNRKYDLKYRILADWDMNIYLWKRIEFVYLEMLISKYDTGGISGMITDKIFCRNKRKLILLNLGFLPLLYSYGMSIQYKIKRLKDILSEKLNKILQLK
ncbi:MAG: glycosyltransferase [Duncaniella sp.]|nr:glycosyltransferase [Duncaniella sp.]